MGIGRVGDGGFLHRRIDSHDRRVGEAQLGRPDGDYIGGLSRRLRGQPRTKRFDLGVVGSVPGINNTPSAEKLVGSIVLDGPFDLTVGEVVEPLEEQGPQVDPPPEFSAEPPLALGRGVFQIGQYYIGETLPRDDVGPLEQRMGR